MKGFKRIICYAAYYGFAQWLPASHQPAGKMAKAIRYLICRHLLAHCGKNVNIEPRADFRSGRLVSIGDNSGIGQNAKLGGQVAIGSDVMMGPDVIIWTRNHVFSRIDIPMAEQGFEAEQPVSIGDDVWIGFRVMILPGVKIGKGAILGAGAVVTKDVPEWAIVVGNPARVLRFRTNTSDKTSEQLAGTYLGTNH